MFCVLGISIGSIYLAGNGFYALFAVFLGRKGGGGVMLAFELILLS